MNNLEILQYINSLDDESKAIGDYLYILIDEKYKKLENKIWHGHPVWFMDGNPIVGFSKLKKCIRLMFWSGMSFEEEKLKPGTGKFKDASIDYTNVSEVKKSDINRWLKKAKDIQWDYKNIVKRKGVLMPLRGIE